MWLWENMAPFASMATKPAYKKGEKYKEEEEEEEEEEEDDDDDEEEVERGRDILSYFEMHLPI